MIIPERLKKGDTIAVIAPAGPPDPVKLREGLEYFKEVGLCVQFGRFLFDQEGYLAASDPKRLDDFHQAFADPSIKGVICVRGGYGTARMAPFINYSLIRNNPKVFWGYSDITYLHGAIQKFSRLSTFHGPMIASDLLEEKQVSDTIRSFNQLFEPTEVCFDNSPQTLSVLQHGIGRGRLVGGNLTLVADSVGTPYQWETENSILLLEEVSEPVYRIDAMLQQLKQAGVFRHIQGVVLGDFNMGEEEPAGLERLFREFFRNCPFPVLKGIKVGHCTPNYGVPLGVEAFLSTAKPCFRIQPGVC
ncbi:S66 peptidase family protein [Halobacillus salinus]|uniref:S66 peptidase family protein n=1 Tax=Halobacillus salinus TaxID=192814 RepID=UPI0009A74FA2|nr:LD-carboxypeptidase [Halobacillus salinus]